MFYAVTELLTIATIWTWVESLQFNPFMPTQPNPWVDATHVHVWGGTLLGLLSAAREDIDCSGDGKC